MSGFRILSVLALTLVLALSACKKDPVVPPKDDTPDEPETSIRFYAKENDSTIIQGVFVGITPNEVDRNNGIYLRSATTNSAGYADFKNLLGITYYYSLSNPAPGGAVVRKGSITLDVGDEVERDIDF